MTEEMLIKNSLKEIEKSLEKFKPNNRTSIMGSISQDHEIAIIKVINNYILNAKNEVFSFERRSQVIKKNMIDWTTGDYNNIFKMGAKGEEKLKKEYGEEAYLKMEPYFQIPPFESGVIKTKYVPGITDEYMEKGEFYFSWNIEFIDLDSNTMDINVVEYHFDQETKWTIEFVGIIHCNIGKMMIAFDTFYPDINLFMDTDLKEYYSDEMYPGFGSFENFYYVYLNRTRMLIERNERRDCDLDFFISMIECINISLLSNKNKTSVKRTDTVSQKPLSVIYKEPKNERKIRVLGDITFISDEPPKAHESVVTIRKYKCASWTVRAHLRTYKNGKMVFIKEHTSRRHGINTPLPEAKTTIVVKNSKPGV